MHPQRAWTYPASCAAGEQVRFGLFELRDGVPMEDTESIASGGFTVTGPGAPARPPAHRAHLVPAGRLAMRTILWADARTCLPLRAVATMRAGPGDVLFQTVTTEYQILTADFTRTARSPRFYARPAAGPGVSDRSRGV